MVGCILTKGNKIVSSATNLGRTHPIQAEYAWRAGYPNKLWLHAEIRALIQANEEADTAFVARVNRRGETRNAKPCSVCMSALLDTEIKHLYFTDENGIWRYKNLKEVEVLEYENNSF